MSGSLAPAYACTRALYVAKDGTVIVGRSMDWGEDMMSNMWVLPRGMKRDGRGGKNTISWESKYGSLIVTAYDIGTAEGMNEKGLVVNELALVESDYGKPPEGANVISLSTWPQYVLDNFASVAEAVADASQWQNVRVQMTGWRIQVWANDSLIIEITGAGDKIDGLVEVLRPFGILEMVRTGVVAMGRGVSVASEVNNNGNGHKSYQ